MPRRAVSFAALVAALGGVALLVAVSARGPGGAGFWGAPVAAPPVEPEVVLHGMEMREVRGAGDQYRLFSDRATYRLQTGKVSAVGVTLEIPDAAGIVTVRAPSAAWDTKTGQVLLPEGGTAVNGAGWSAEVAEARLSLPGRELVSAGAARLAGPGLVVAGSNLVWRWREGKAAIERPKTRIEPARTAAGRG